MPQGKTGGGESGTLGRWVEKNFLGRKLHISKEEVPPINPHKTLE